MPPSACPCCTLPTGSSSTCSTDRQPDDRGLARQRWRVLSLAAVAGWAMTADSAVGTHDVGDGRAQRPGVGDARAVRLRPRRRSTSSAASPGCRPTSRDCAPGGVGAQFWSVFVPCSLRGGAAVTAHAGADRLHPADGWPVPRAFALATTAAEVEAAVASGRIASLMGMEGGHSIDSSLAALRMMHALGRALHDPDAQRERAVGGLRDGRAGRSVGSPTSAATSCGR